MRAHFSSFTPEAMRALRQDLVAGFRRRREFLRKTRSHTSAMLADFRRAHRDAEAQRRQRVAHEADGRRLFVSEIRSGVHALRNRFELGRRETAADLRGMAAELHAASEAFFSRPSQRAASFFRGPARPETVPARQQGVKAEDGATSGFASEERPGKKRHG